VPLVLDSGDPHQEEPFRHFVARGWQRVRGGAYQSANFPTTPHSFQPDAGRRQGRLCPQDRSEEGARREFCANDSDLPGSSYWDYPVRHKTVLLHSVGSKALSIEGIHTVGMFAQTSTCGGSLAGGGSCAISIVFTPGVPGMQMGAVVVNDNARGSPQELILTGTGLAVE